MKQLSQKNKSSKLSIFVIGACEMHNVKIAGKMNFKGREIFNKMINEKDKFIPTFEEFIMKFQMLINEGFIVVESVDDIENHNQMFKWFKNKLGEKNYAR
jgi:hypothetical protein